MRAFGLLFLLTACQSAPATQAAPISGGKADAPSDQAGLPLQADGSVDVGFKVMLPASRTQYRYDEWKPSQSPYVLDQSDLTLSLACRVKGPSPDQVRVICLSGSEWGGVWPDGTFITYAIAAEESDYANGHLQGRLLSDGNIEIDRYDYTLPHHSGDYQEGPDRSYQRWYVDSFNDALVVQLR